jgi:hypothetical protein
VLAFDPMLELGPRTMGDKIHYFRELQLLKFSGRIQDRTSEDLQMSVG